MVKPVVRSRTDKVEGELLRATTLLKDIAREKKFHSKAIGTDSFGIQQLLETEEQLAQNRRASRSGSRLHMVFDLRDSDRIPAAGPVPKLGPADMTKHSPHRQMLGLVITFSRPAAAILATVP